VKEENIDIIPQQIIGVHLETKNSQKIPYSLYISTKRIAFFGYTDTILF